MLKDILSVVLKCLVEVDYSYNSPTKTHLGKVLMSDNVDLSIYNFMTLKTLVQL